MRKERRRYGLDTNGFAFWEGLSLSLAECFLILKQSLKLQLQRELIHVDSRDTTTEERALDLHFEDKGLNPSASIYQLLEAMRTFSLAQSHFLI